MRKALKIGVPWTITIVALYIAFRGISWDALRLHIGEAQPWWILLAVALTILSYLLRAARWRILFPVPCISFIDAAKVLFLGFFMNNILPARAGELARAHLGACVTRQSRMLVLATVASERLIDGLTLSLFFVAFAFGAGDGALSQDFFLVACAFAAVALGVLATLAFRTRIFSLAEALHLKFDTGLSHYLFKRFQIFVNGLAPVFTLSKMLPLGIWSVVIWGVELSVYYCVSRAFGTALDLSYCVLFLVAVNFSSLIPAAPGGIGVIEAIGSQVLHSIGLPRELSLTMVMAQHAIQYLVVGIFGIPGLLVMLSGKVGLNRELDMAEDEEREANLTA